MCTRVRELNELPQFFRFRSTSLSRHTLLHHTYLHTFCSSLILIFFIINLTLWRSELTTYDKDVVAGVSRILQNSIRIHAMRLMNDNVDETEQRQRRMSQQYLSWPQKWASHHWWSMLLAIPLCCLKWRRQIDFIHIFCCCFSFQHFDRSQIERESHSTVDTFN